VAFILDRSGSIATRGQTYNIELQGVATALRDASVIPRDGSIAVAVLLFAEDAQVIVPLTQINSPADAERIASTVESRACASIGSLTAPCPFGGTSFTAAITTADADLNKNRRQGARRVMILSSDGEPNDLGLAIEASVEARNAARIQGITSELNGILVGVSGDEVAENRARIDQVVFPMPAADLPGATLVVNGGACSEPGAAAGSDDCLRQATDFAEATRRILRSDVPTASLVVTTEEDTAPGAPSIAGGPLSLRQAIERANCNGGATTITFASGVRGKTIRPLVPLPALAHPDIVIDGCDGPDCAASITLDGAGTNTATGEAHPHGLLIRSNRNVVRGLRIANFPGAGVAIDRLCPNDNAVRNRVEQNVLENNAKFGVLVADTISEGKGDTNIRNTISRNAISASATPIDLTGDGPTANDVGDPDAGPNALLNFPDTINVVATGQTVGVAGQVSGPASAGSTVEIYAVTSFVFVADRLVIEGVSFLAEATTAANGSFSATGVAQSPTGVYTATVTDRAGNTSELMSDTGNTRPARPVPEVTTSVNFGDTQVNTSPDPRPVTVTNNGNAPLIVTGCSIVKCSPSDRDDTARFTITGCPTAPLNPGERATIRVTYRPTVCGPARACLALTTNNARQAVIQTELVANAVGAALARLTLQGGAAALEFGPVTPRGKPRKVKVKQARTFTVENLGCDQLNITLATITRVTDAGRLANTDDRDFFSVSRLNPNGTETPVAVGPNATFSLGGLQSATFRVRFRPVIPVVVDCPGGPSGLAANRVLPDEVMSRLTINQNAGAPLAVNLVGRVSTNVRMIDPCSPSEPPLVTLVRSGSEFIVQFSVFDSNLDANRATFQFLNSVGQAVGEAFNIDLTAAIRERNLVEGQSFTVSQTFTGGLSAVQINSVRVTVSDGSSSDTATSGSVTTSATAAGLRLQSAGSATLRLPKARIPRSGSRADR
jgi:hypothetical protein